MKIIVAGGGAVGKSIALNMSRSKKYELVIIDIEEEDIQKTKIPGVKWVTGDVCDIDVFTKAGGLETDIFVAATGDDQTNLVSSMIAKTHFSIKKTISRVNHPKNESLFTDTWGVDIAVSTPKIISRFIEDAAKTDELVSIYEFSKSGAQLLKYTIGEDSKDKGKILKEFVYPKNTTLCAINRDDMTFTPSDDIILEANDELIFIA